MSKDVYNQIEYIRQLSNLLIELLQEQRVEIDQSSPVLSNPGVFDICGVFSVEYDWNGIEDICVEFTRLEIRVWFRSDPHRGSPSLDDMRTLKKFVDRVLAEMKQKELDIYGKSYPQDATST